MCFSFYISLVRVSVHFVVIGIITFLLAYLEKKISEFTHRASSNSMHHIVCRRWRAFQRGGRKEVGGGGTF